MKKLSIIILLNTTFLLTSCGNKETNSDNELSEFSVTDSSISETTEPETEPQTQPETEIKTEPINFTLSNTFGDTIVDRIYLTMPKNKVFAVTGEDYDDTFCWGEGFDTYYTFYIDSFKKLEIEIEASANFGFDENDELHSFYYSIGYDENDNCIYSAEEIENIYNTMFEAINEKYGEYHNIYNMETRSLPFFE
ncbi:MAG: hypothetical protein K2H19_08380 [Ruminococcus sp.]|nr:hypothetical protein [Ruminococcus sp.]